MMNLSRLIAVLVTAHLLGGLVSFATTPAGAMRPDSQAVRWKKPVIQIAVSTSLTQPNPNIKPNSDVLGALSRSLDAWSNAAGIEFSLATTDKQNVSPQGQAGDGVNLITIAQTPENVMFFSRDPVSEAARTRLFFNRRGFITEADIVLSPFQQFSTDGTYGTFDLETAFAHEIGHLLGLKHSAVMGSIMSETVARNTTTRLLGVEMPLLSDGDVSAIRSLYGSDNDECCGTANGKLVLQSGKPLRRSLVWAEEASSGRLVGTAETASDGSYRIGGLNSGEYLLFWQRKENDQPQSFGELGSVRIERGTAPVPTQKLSLARSEVSLTHIGVGMQLGESAVSLTPGARYLVLLGGKGLDAGTLSLEFNSPFLEVESQSLRPEDFGDEIEAVSFILRVDRDIPPGSYSVFARRRDGERAVLVGAIVVMPAPK